MPLCVQADPACLKLCTAFNGTWLCFCCLKNGQPCIRFLLPVQVPGLEGKQQIPFVHEVASDKVRHARAHRMFTKPHLQQLAVL